ncbi:CHAP domain-containing protein [Nonomuraea sp. SMC257]|uniref:CHAP domain-containing protein n=1 Tax=Nonomuraea montanisoli TaxID=2741721 RepID=A0A7Y6IEQ8_9ACTN|nr:CHAP domain-containing protein [Nonomuraea montanisoli]NUW36776.1 CHAP domain-containing protein [Nonomuraea montanisoli]
MRKFIDLLESQLGYSERGGAYTKFGDWYGKNVEFDADYTSAPWCDMMLSWAAHKLGYGEWMGQFAWTVSHAKWFRKHDAWGRKPEPGAFVFFDWSGSHDLDRIDHVGIVTRVEGNTIHTIEGNIDGGVLKRKERDTSKVVGYGYPWRIKERLDREARENQVDPVLPPANTDTGLLQQTDSTLGALIPSSEVTIVQPPLAARAQPTAKPADGAQQAAGPTPTPQTQPAQPQTQIQAQAQPQATSSAATNTDKAAKKGKHAKPATADTKAVTSEPLAPLGDASAAHPSPALESPTLVGSALVAALALLAVAKTRHMRARPALAAAAPAAPGRRRHRRPRRPAFASAAESVPVKATMVRRTTADATLTTRTTAAARATAGAALAAGATATAAATLVASTTARGAAALASGTTANGREAAFAGGTGGGRSAHPAADALLETVEPVSASRPAALGGSAAASRSGSGYGAGAASSADFFPVDPAATGPMPLHPDILASLSEDASAAPLEPTAIHQGTPLEALGARRIVPVDTSPDPAAARGRFVPLETAAAQWGMSLETIAARLALPPGTFAIPEATSRFDAFGPRTAAAADRPGARTPETPHAPVAARATRYAPSEPWPAAESLPPDVALLVRDAQTLLRDAQGLPREEEPWDAFGRRPRPMSSVEPSYGSYARLGGLQGGSRALEGVQGGYARADDGLGDRSARAEGARSGSARMTGPQGRPGRQDVAGRSGRQDLPSRSGRQEFAGRSGRQDASTGGYRGRRRLSGHPVEEPATFSPDAAPRGRRHRGMAQHRTEQPHHMDARRIDPYWVHPQPAPSHRPDAHSGEAQPGDGLPGSHRGGTHGSDAHRGDAHRAGGRWDVRQLEPRWSDQFAQDGPLRGRRHRSPAHAAAESAPHRVASTATPPLSAPPLSAPALSEASLSGTSLPGPSFSGASPSGASLLGPSFSGASLSGASSSVRSFSGASSSEPSLSGASPTGPAASSTTAPEAGDRSPGTPVTDSPARQSRRRRGRHRA